MPRYSARTDANQSDLVKRLRELGYSVETNTARIGEGFPDLLVGGEFPCPHCGVSFKQNLLIEVKSEGGKLTGPQEKWHGNWQGQKDIARNTEDLDRIAGRNRITAIWVSGREASRKAHAKAGEAREAAAQDDLNDGAYRLPEEAWVRPVHDTGDAGTESAA